MRDYYRQLRVYCVRTGTKYAPGCIDKLRSMLGRHLSCPHELVCITDGPVPHGVWPVQAEFPEWWAKVEVFRESDDSYANLYFDLDTVIVDSVDPLAEAVLGAADGERALYMLKRFNPAKTGWMSGVMAWVGDWSFIYTSYDDRRHRARFPGDQEFITHVLANTPDRGPVAAVQSVLPGVYSYKVNMRQKDRLLPGTRVVCFHGRPRITQVRDRWLSEHWR